MLSLPFLSNQGSGSISLFQKVKRVIGIELCQEAVEDARVNALTNGENFYIIASRWSATARLSAGHFNWVYNLIRVLGTSYKVGH